MKMSLFNILLTGCVGTKVLTSTLGRYTSEDEYGRKTSTVGKIVDDLDTVSTIGMTSLCILRLWKVWSKVL